MPPRARSLDLRLRLARGLRSRGASSSSSLVLGLGALALGDGFFGGSSSMVTRSCGVRRNSLKEAASPNSGSLRPPLFFRPHAIRKRLHRPMRAPYRVGFKGALSDG